MMIKPKLYKIDESGYYMVSELIKYPQTRRYFKGCKQSPRKCLIKHCINYSDYVCAIQINNCWKSGYNVSFKRAVLFLKEQYVNDYIIIKSAHKKDVPDIVNVFSKYVCDFSCIYLFHIGDIEQLDFIDTTHQKEMHEKCFVYKFGITNSIQRRTNEHLRTFNSYNNVELNIELFAYVHNDFLYDAENKLKQYFKMSDMIVNHSTYKELVMIPKSKLQYVRNLYNDVYTLFN